jgi:signal transduction histidine kinase
VSVVTSRRLRLLSANPELLEQTQYNSRRLAKLGIPAETVLARLSGTGLPPSDLLQIALVVNRSYAEVRESEVQVLEELFQAEHGGGDLAQTLSRFSDALQRYANAARAKIEFPANLPASLRKPVCFKVKPGDRRVLDPKWKVATCWSVPLGSRGVIQLGFDRHYPWLHRERELLGIAAQRCLAAAEKAGLMEELRHREEEVRRLARHVVEVEELERRRISRDLHDEAGQSLLCIRLNLETLERAVSGEAQVRLRETRELTERTVDEIRRLLSALNPEALEKLGLAAAIRQIAQRLRAVTPIVTEVEVGPLPEIHPRVQLVAYRLAQESIQNAGRHSQARRLTVSMHSADGFIKARIEDDGRGLDAEANADRSGAFGLAGMRERAELLGGRFQVISPVRRGRGTAILFELPIGESSELCPKSN